jgi:hypothetical protein|tara:strand:- start:865 stop:1170 length:306 start_codon:yes stop_codon:yes gene_type:complete
MNRSDCLDTAKDLINGDRAHYYGDAYDNHDRIAQLWNAYLQWDYELSVKDVIAMMVMLKVARLRHTATHDSFVDICGYAALGCEMTSDEAKAVGEDDVGGC